MKSLIMLFAFSLVQASMATQIKLTNVKKNEYQKSFCENVIPAVNKAYRTVVLNTLTCKEGVFKLFRVIENNKKILRATVDMETYRGRQQVTVFADLVTNGVVTNFVNIRVDGLGGE